jgi:hypothetical protein
MKLHTWEVILAWIAITLIAIYINEKMKDD